MEETELVVIIPVYNEGEIISEVICNWVLKLRSLHIRFRLHAYNDGSKDNTSEILHQINYKYAELIVHDKPNSGHGSTILQGYRENVNAKWIFQTDSDNEISPEYFDSLWSERENYDFLSGRRKNRMQPVARKCISGISRFTVRLFYKSGVWDVNSPFRLMRADKFSEVFNKIPEQTFAPNVIISGYTGLKNMRILEIDVPHKNRETGEVSIKRFRLFKSALRSFIQTIKCRFII